MNRRFALPFIGRLRYPPGLARIHRKGPDSKRFILFSRHLDRDSAEALGERLETPDMPDLQIQIERLTDQPDRFEFEVGAEWWLDREPEPRKEGFGVEIPFSISLVASRTKDDVLIEGEIQGRVAAECSRCGKRYPQPLLDTFRLVLNPAKGHALPDPEGERGLAQNGVCLGEDLEAGLYRGPVIRLDDFFGEVIALAVPMQPLCDEGCLGICPHCGLDRNSFESSGNRSDETRPAGSTDPVAMCECKDEKIESPFAVLASLRNDLANRDGA